MNRKIALILLGTVCLVALINSSSAKSTAKPDQTTTTTAVQKEDASSEEEHGKNGEHGHGHGHGKKHGAGRGHGGKGGFRHGEDFRKEVEKIFDENKVDPTVRDKILDTIKERMEQMRKGKGHGKHSGDAKKEEATTAKATAAPKKA